MERNEISEPEAIRELTHEYIGHWQSLGLMPEVAPGEVLVWKNAYPRRNLVTRGEDQWEWVYTGYSSMWDKAEFATGLPSEYECEKCHVSANPLGLYCGSERHRGERTCLLALRVKVEDIRLCPTIRERGVRFYAPRGVVIGAYKTNWSRHDEFQFELAEGEDALARLPDPLVDVLSDHVSEDRGNLPPPLAEVENKRRKYVRDRERNQYMPDVSEALEYWQKQGWMPEPFPGKILVWKYAARLGAYRGRSVEYRVERHDDWGQRFWLGCPFEGRHDLEVFPTWDDDLPWEPDNHGREMTVIAILADREALEFCGYSEDYMGFFAPQGVPVACYEAALAGGFEFAFRLVEGEDVREWLP